MQDVNVMDGIVGEMRCEMNKKNLFFTILILFITCGILWLISNYYAIPLVWILSPLWEILLMICLAIIMALLRTFFIILMDLFKYHKDLKEKNNED